MGAAPPGQGAEATRPGSVYPEIVALGGVRAAGPAQLPADIGDFTGRKEHLRRLRELLAPQDEGRASPGAVNIAGVVGTPGLGKTVLAVHAAHQLRHDFPDGQLYVSLLGASQQPAKPDEVLARLLRDLGLEPNRIPASLDERAALYRTRLTDRKVLIVLDDARDAAQVRPLLPAAAGGPPGSLGLHVQLPDPTDSAAGLATLVALRRVLSGGPAAGGVGVEADHRLRRQAPDFLQLLLGEGGAEGGNGA